MHRIIAVVSFCIIALLAVSPHSNSSDGPEKLLPWPSDSVPETLSTPSPDGNLNTRLSKYSARDHNGKPGYLYGIAVEQGGTPWVIDGSGVHYWDGSRFRQPTGPKLVGGTYADRLVGGGDRALYALQRGDSNRNGKVYKLSDGEVTLITDYHRDTQTEQPGFYVSKSGKLYNWGLTYLAVYSGDKWKRIEASLGFANTPVFDTGDVVYFYMNGNLYSADRNDNIEQQMVDIPFKVEPNRSLGDRSALWGKDSAVLLNYSSFNLCILDLKSGKVIPTPPQIKEHLKDKSLYDIFPAKDGSVWILANDNLDYKYRFHVLKPNGEIKEIRATDNLAWENNRIIQYPKSMLSTSDGAVWFGQTKGGLTRWKDGQLTSYGWEEGLPVPTINWVMEGRDGMIWAATSQQVYAMTPKSVPEIKSPEWSRWQEVVTTGRAPIVDSDGGIWCFLKERPDEISRWDGTNWTHVQLPSGAANINSYPENPGIADDRGHVLIEVYGITAAGWDVSLDGVTEYPGIKEAIVAAVKSGVKSFETGFSYVGCAVLPNGRIVYSARYNDGLFLYDGKAWTKFDSVSSRSHILESTEYGFLLSHDNRTYDYYDRGLFEKFVPPANPKFMLGPAGLQPYDELLLRHKPDFYFAVESDSQSKLRIVKCTGRASASPELGDTIVESPHGPIESIKSPFGGLWTNPELSSGPYRIFGSSVFKCDFAGTPVEGLEMSCKSIFDDNAGNTWVDAGRYGGSGHLFIRTATPQVLTVGEIPETCGHTLHIKLAEISGMPNDARLFWKIGNDPWQGGDAGKGRVAFTSEGKQQVSVMALDNMGSQVAKSITFTVDASMTWPDTVLTSNGPFTVTDLDWKLPATAKPSGPGMITKLRYRIDGGKWKPAQNDNYARLAGLKSGKHTMEIAAVEDTDFFDQTPVSFTFNFEPNWQKFVAGKLEMLGSENPDTVQQAIQDLKEAGPDIMPILKQQTNELKRKYRMIPSIEQLMRNSESKKNQKKF